MVTGTLTMIPPIIVLKNGGKISLKKLEEKCLEIDTGRFEGEDMKGIIERYSSCLKEKNGVVRFDTESVKYAKHGIMERSLQFILHSAIPEMEKWQLYPLKTKKNSPTCYIGAPWEIIPIDSQEVNYNTFCDFRWDGKDHCTLGCGVDENYFR